MYLCMDDNGKIYQAASYRSDGRGFEKMPAKADSGDLCLGSPYLNQENMSKNEWAMLKSYNAQQDEMDLKAQIARKQIAQNRAWRAQQEDMKMQIPAYKNHLTKEAAVQAMSGADFSTNSIWGYSSNKHANGLGRSNNEVLIEAAMLQSMGEVPSAANTQEISTAVVNVDPYEIEQYYLAQEANKYITQSGEATALQREKELMLEKQMKSTSAHIDSTGDAVLVEPQARYVEDEQAKTAEMLKKVGIGLGVLALFNYIKG